MTKFYTSQQLPPVSQTADPAPAQAPRHPSRLLLLDDAPLSPSTCNGAANAACGSEICEDPAEIVKKAQVRALGEPTAAAEEAPARKPCSQKGARMKTQAKLKLPEGMSPEDFLQQVRVNPQARLEGRGLQAKVATAAIPGQARSEPQLPESVFDHPDVGGKFTVCVLLYGGQEYYDLHQRCLSSILASVPRDRMELRVGSNALNPKSLAMVEALVAQGAVRKHYRHVENAYKYPVMREMLHDPELPITTKWIVWFDDDSIADRTPEWLKILATAIVQHHRKDNAHMFGAPFVYTLNATQRAWYASRPWYRGRPWRLSNGQPSPSGDKVIFCTGGFWALSTEAMRACDIPDALATHNGGDILQGEQLHQGGFGMKSFNAKKQFVHTSSVKRRGESQPHFGTAEWQKSNASRLKLST